MVDPLVGYAMVAVLSTVLLGIGVYSARAGRVVDFDDYAVCGRSVGLGLGIGTLLASWVTASTIIAAPQIAYQLGYLGAIGYAMGGVGLVLFAPMAKRIRRMIDALHALAPETKAPGRDIALDEVRYALSTLSPARIMPDAPPTVSKVVHALLTATEPLSQRELADRVGVSRRSVRNHREVLEAFDLVREVDGGLRFALPFYDERTDRDGGAAVLPYYAVGNPDRDALTQASDVLFEAVATLLDDSSRLADPNDPIGGPFFTASSGFDAGRLTDPGAWPWLAPWLSVIEALLDVSGETDRDRSPPPIIMGIDPDQRALRQTSTPAAITSGAATVDTR